MLLQIFEGIRDFIVQSVELKFNCFFLMPLVDTFPQHLREQLEGAWEEDIEGELLVWLVACPGHVCALYDCFVHCQHYIRPWQRHKLTFSCGMFGCVALQVCLM